MESTTCAVHQSVHQAETLDGVPVLDPAPTSIKDQMPELAALLQQLAVNVDRGFVQDMVRAAVDLRLAYDRDDYQAVKAVYARRHGWIDCAEGGYQLGVPEVHMKAFARRHRRAANDR